MLIDLEYLQNKYDLTVNGVLHVGAHYGEEKDIYKKLGYSPVFWIEGDGESIPILTYNVKDFTDHHVIQAICLDEPRSVRFNIANNGQSSSVLELGTHLQEHPEVFYTQTKEVFATTVDELKQFGFIDQCNFMNLDVQGAEHLVLRGAVEYLEGVTYLYSEVNQKELYKDCCLMKDLDRWLLAFGFKRLDTEMTKHGWGDAFYSRATI